MSSVATQQVHAGHTIRFKVDGQEIGRGQSITGNVSFGQQPVHQIGSIMPAEHVALQYAGSVSMDKFKIRKKSLVDLGLAALGIGILNMDVIDIEVTDRYTNEVVDVYRGCSLNEYTKNHAANSISGENATWLFLSADQGKPEVVQ